MIVDAPLSRVLLVHILLPCAYRALLHDATYRILTDPLPGIKKKITETSLNVSTTSSQSYYFRRAACGFQQVSYCVNFFVGKRGCLETIKTETIKCLVKSVLISLSLSKKWKILCRMRSISDTNHTVVSCIITIMVILIKNVVVLIEKESNFRRKVTSWSIQNSVGGC